MLTRNAGVHRESPGSNDESGAAIKSTDRSTVETAGPALSVGRRLFVYLGAVALVFAFISGLKTLFDPDSFWQLATGRWIAQHHQIPSIDVFSYTVAGQPWIYPVGSALLLYGTYLLGGYALLSWLGAAACCSTVALLLRKGSAVTAALVIVAVPVIAGRTNPRADMFTTILFAAYLSILWENYRTGHARLWLLPLLMMAWVNLHPGFVSGLALIAAFVGMDALQMLPRTARDPALQRLRRGAPWFLATGLATLVNPWGWGIYRWLLWQNRAMAELSEWIAEWGRVPLSWTGFAKAFSPHNPSAPYILLTLAATTIIAALLRRQFGAALLLLAACSVGIQYYRLMALTSGIVVIVGSAILLPAVEQLGRSIRSTRMRALLAASAATIVLLFAVVSVVNALKVKDMALFSFGTGIAWWYPEGAAAFVERENIPGETISGYPQGGYLIWRLGPRRRDYIDGRMIPFGPEALLHHAQLFASPLDSPPWQSEADRYNINIILLPINRFQPELGCLAGYCRSKNWKPVYLDEVAAVFVRRTAETEDLIQRLGVDCATAPLPAAVPAGSASERFNQWADTAVVLSELRRNREALAAAEKAREIFPESGLVPWLRGNVAYAGGMYADAEREYRQAVANDADLPLFWFSLATVYKHQGRIPETITAERKAIELSTLPKPYEWLKLARLYLDIQQPKMALTTFDEAERAASPDLLAATGEHNFRFDVDQGRAAAWRALGDATRAAMFDQKAVQDLVPTH